MEHNILDRQNTLIIFSSAIAVKQEIFLQTEKAYKRANNDFFIVHQMHFKYAFIGLCSFLTLFNLQILNFCS